VAYLKDRGEKGEKVHEQTANTVTVYINKERKGGAGGRFALRSATAFDSHRYVKDHLAVMNAAGNHFERNDGADRGGTEFAQAVAALRTGNGILAGENLHLPLTESVILALGAFATESARVFRRHENAANGNAEIRRFQQVRKVCPSCCNLTARLLRNRFEARINLSFGVCHNGVFLLSVSVGIT